MNLLFQENEVLCIESDHCAENVAGHGKAKGIARKLLKLLRFHHAEALAAGDFDEMAELLKVVCAVKPGDGSAREQAASCQRVLGASANIAREYATKRYRSNLINWGMLPLISKDRFEVNDVIIMPDVKTRLIAQNSFSAYLVRNGAVKRITLDMDTITLTERDIILAGSLINYYAESAKKED